MKKVFKYLPLLAITPMMLSSCKSYLSFITSKRDGMRITDVQYAYLTNNNPADTTPYNGNMSVGAPNPIRLKWNAKGIKRYKVTIASDPDFRNIEAVYKTNKTHLDFYNDKFNTKYFWKVEGVDKPGASRTDVFEYAPTVTQPRNLYVDGVENIRDIGGWVKVDDSGVTRYMKQGMIYRSGRFNEYDDENEKSVNTITKKGLNEVKSHLKFKTEIDLRRSSTNETGGITSSVLGDDVNYVNLPMYYGGQNILTYTGKPSGDDYQYNNPLMIKQFFELLEDSRNYPINFHCSIGKDRTGCLAYLIEGLMGFDQEIMYRDYMFTNFSNAGMCKLQDDVLSSSRYGYTLANYEGDTISEKVYNYLNNVIGLTTTQLNRIINILRN